MCKLLYALLITLTLSTTAKAQSNTIEFSYARTARQKPIQITGPSIGSLYDENPRFFDRDFALGLQLRHRLKDSCYFWDAGMRLRMMRQSTPFSYSGDTKIDFTTGGSLRPIVDLSIAIGYEYRWKRLSVAGRAGLAGFWCIHKSDTSILIELGTLNSMGYRGNAFKLGFLVGIDANFWISKRTYIGFDVTYSHAFNQDYPYIRRELPQYAPQPDYLFGWHAKSLQTGIHIGLPIGKSLKKSDKRSTK